MATLRHWIAFQEANVFKQGLHQAKNIAEKASLDNLFKSSQKLACEVVFTLHFLWNKPTGQAYGKNNWPTRASTHIWER